MSSQPKIQMYKPFSIMSRYITNENVPDAGLRNYVTMPRNYISIFAEAFYKNVSAPAAAASPLTFLRPMSMSLKLQASIVAPVV